MIEIAKGAVVLDTKTQVDYVLEKHIASGLYSHIYVAKRVTISPIGHREMPKIAKVGSLSEDQRQDQQSFEKRVRTLKERYDTERNVIEQLRTHSQGRFAPEVIQGEWKDRAIRDVPVLLMDRMGSDTENWSLASQLRGVWSNDLEAERLAVQAGIHYAEMLEVLHARLNRTCSDRKSGDIYWDPTQKALYVLDWNVVGVLSGAPDMGTEGNQPSHGKIGTVEGERQGQSIPDERQRQIQNEIRLFGRLWFEMLVGMLPENFDVLSIEKPQPGSRWAGLSQGMRRMLIRTLSSGLTEDGFRDDLTVKDSWMEYAKMLSSDASGLHEMARQAKDSSSSQLWKQSWETINDIRDLLDRMPGMQHRSAEIGRWIDEKSTELDRRFEQQMRDPRGQVRDGNYRAAVLPLQEIVADDTFDCAQRRASARWLWIARTLSEVSVASHGNELELKKHLIDLLEVMQQRDWPSAQKRLQAVVREAE